MTCLGRTNIVICLGVLEVEAMEAILDKFRIRVGTSGVVCGCAGVTFNLDCAIHTYCFVNSHACTLVNI
jgi:hypothetical protein